MLRAALVLWLCFAASLTSASPIGASLPGAELRGQATFRFLGLPVYNARLYTQQGAAFSWQNDFALELKYLRRLSQKSLVESTLQEMDRIGAPVPIKNQLMTCFYDVGKGDSYVAISDGPNAVKFWRNGRKTCTLSHPQITQRFMEIFLGDNTRSKNFTRKLKGL